jgi:hypothetical protein
VMSSIHEKDFAQASVVSDQEQRPDRAFDLGVAPVHFFGLIHRIDHRREYRWSFSDFYANAEVRSAGCPTVNLEHDSLLAAFGLNFDVDVH